MRHITASLLFIAFLFLEAPLHAGEFTSPKGFRLSFPDDWKSKSDQEMAAIRKDAKQKLGVDVPTMEAYVGGPISDGVQPNINVIVKDAVVVLDKKTEDEVVKGIKGQLAASFGIAESAIKVAMPLWMAMGESLSVTNEPTRPSTNSCGHGK